MAEDNCDVLRRTVDAINRGDVDAVLETLPIAVIAVLRAGRIVSLKDYGERRKALHAAGLDA
jgi:hypothetical protein